MVNFVENHDGLNRFRAAGIDVRQNTLANATVLTLEGIPCLYYGTEIALEDTDGQIGKDGETGRRTLWPRGTDAAKLVAAAKGSALAPFLRLRRELPALHTGRIATLWVDGAGGSEDDGIFAFARYVEKDGAIDPAQTVIVVGNGNGMQAAETRVKEHAMPLVVGGRALLGKGQTLECVNAPAADAKAAVVWRDGKPETVLPVPALGCRIYKVVPAQ
jgi:hypothetical protein